MKRFRRFAAWACVAFAAAAFAVAAALALLGQRAPSPLDLVWVESGFAREAMVPELPPLGLREGDRLRVLRPAKESWVAQTIFPERSGVWQALPSLSGLLGEVLEGAQPGWICRSDREIEELPSFPPGVPLVFLVREGAQPEGWEFRRFAVPSEIRVGRPFSLRWELASLRECRGRFRVWLDDEVVGESSFVCVGRTTEGAISLLARKAGTSRLRLEALEGLVAERPPEIWGEVVILPEPKLGLLGSPNDISRLLEAQGFVAASETESMESADLVLVTREMTPEQGESVERFLRAGGGAIVFGPEAMGRRSILSSAWLPGRMEARPVAALHEKTSPVPGKTQDASPAPSQPSRPPDPAIAPIQETRESAVVALMLVLDKSGSMAGEKLDRTFEAAIETAKTLAPEDWIGVLAFDREIVELLPMGPVSSVSDLRARLEKVDAGGGTRIFPALNRAAQDLARAPAAIKHLILLTDGATEDKVSKDAPYFEFMSEQSKRGLTLTAVGIRGGDYDAEFLSNLAVWGRGRFYPVDADRVPQIFTLEAKRVKSGGGKPVSDLPRTPPQELSVSVKDPHPSLQGIDWQKPEPAPPLKGMQVMEPWPWSSVALLAGGQPLLAIGHVGAGRVALWASSGEGEALASWLPDARAQQFWTQLAEYLRRRDEGGAQRQFDRGADWSHRLRTPEESLREVAAMASRCGGVLAEESADWESLLSRKMQVTPHGASPWFAALGAVFSLLGMVAFSARERI